MKLASGGPGFSVMTKVGIWYCPYFPTYDSFDKTPGYAEVLLRP